MEQVLNGKEKMGKLFLISHFKQVDFNIKCALPVQHIILHSIHLCDFHLFCCIQAGSRLRIPNVERSDEGRYVCTDDNGRIQYVKLVIAGKHKINVSFAVLTGKDQMSRFKPTFRFIVSTNNNSISSLMILYSYLYV